MKRHVHTSGSDMHRNPQRFTRLSRRLLAIACSSWLALFLAVPMASADTVEFLSGAKVEGKILEIRKADREFDFTFQLGTQEVTKTYQYDQVHAVTMGDRRFVINAMPDKPAAGEAVPPAAQTRTPAEINRLIKEAGETPPDWFDSTNLDHPASLELDWPMKPDGGWNNQKNVGQFIWDIVNPNPRRWRSGIKLVHHCMSNHDQQPALLRRDMEKLGVMYFTLLQDYPRAAFWLRKANVSSAQVSGIHLAECYWRMGNKSMALEAIRGNRIHVAAIKLLGDMGELDEALRLTRIYANTQANNEAFLAAADALRTAGDYTQAIAFYQRVLDANTARNQEYEQRFKARAKESIEAIRLREQADVTKVADGTYKGATTGYNGPVQVEVTVEDHKMTSLRVVKHTEKQFYAALDDTPAQILKNQSIDGIDGTSGATITSLAIVNATAKALAQGAQ